MTLRTDWTADKLAREFARQHDVYADAVDGGWAGYRGACHDRNWTGPTIHPSKPDARADAEAHRAAAGTVTKCPHCGGAL